MVLQNVPLTQNKESKQKLFDKNRHNWIKLNNEPFWTRLVNGKTCNTAKQIWIIIHASFVNKAVNDEERRGGGELMENSIDFLLLLSEYIYIFYSHEQPCKTSLFTKHARMRHYLNRHVVPNIQNWAMRYLSDSLEVFPLKFEFEFNGPITRSLPVSLELPMRYSLEKGKCFLLNERVIILVERSLIWLIIKLLKASKTLPLGNIFYQNFFI